MISVCMATWQGERWLGKQLDSLLAQLGMDDELIIADDGSTDGTQALVQARSDARIRFLATSGKRLGPVYNLERALCAARGEYVFLCDQDDIWLPGKVVACLEALRHNDLVLHDAVLLFSGADGNTEVSPEAERLFDIRKPHHGVWANAWKNCYTGCCMAMRRSVLDAALPFPRALPMHDQWLGLVAEASFQVTFLPSPLLAYRQHAGNATDLVDSSRRSWIKRVVWRLRLVVIVFTVLRARVRARRHVAPMGASGEN